MINSYKNTACYYTFKESCIICGEVDSQKNLIITEMEWLKNTSLPGFAARLRFYEKDTKIWSNLHQGLKNLMPKIKEFDIDGENIMESQSLDDIWLSLRDENKIIIDCDAIAEGEVFRKALKILVKSFADDLYRNRLNILNSGSVRRRNDNFRDW
jgi:hypothetical protein